MSVPASLTGYSLAEEGHVAPVAYHSPRRRSDVAVRRVKGETLVLDHCGKQIHQLNCTASYIWDLCDGNTPVEKIVARLVEAFDVGFETATKDVSTTVSQLRKLNLLESCPRSSVFSRL